MAIEFKRLVYQDAIPTKVSQLENDKGYLTQHQSLSNYALKSELFSKSYNDLTNKPTIPTNNNQLTNGAEYITSSALSSYAKTSAIPTKTSQLTNDSNFATKTEVANAIATFVEATDEEIEALFN